MSFNKTMQGSTSTAGGSQTNTPINEQVWSNCLAITESYEQGQRTNPWQSLSSQRPSLLTWMTTWRHLWCSQPIAKCSTVLTSSGLEDSTTPTQLTPWLQLMMHSEGRNSLAMLGMDQMQQMTMQQMPVNSPILQGQSSI